MNNILYFQQNKLFSQLFYIWIAFAGVIVCGIGVLSPAYWSIALVFLLFLFSLKFFVIPQRLYGYFSLIYLSVTYFVLCLFINPTSNRLAGIQVITSLILYFCYIVFFYNIDKDVLLGFIKKYILFCLIFFIIEFITRFHLSGLQFSIFLRPTFWIWEFYKLKECSLFCEDTNFIATHILSVFFLYVYVNRRYGIKVKFGYVMFLILLFLSFCRASWIASIFSLGALIFLTKNKKFYKIRIFSFIFAIVLAIFFGIYIINNLSDSSDGSFLTKISIFERTVYFIKNSSFRDLMFGLGYLNSRIIVGFNVAHNLYSTFLMDTGIIGLGLILLIYLNSLFVSKYYSLFIVLPIFIFGLSFIQQFIPFVYMSIAFIIALENKK